jgi:hypothetical protein
MIKYYLSKSIKINTQKFNIRKNSKKSLTVILIIIKFVGKIVIFKF